MQFLFVVYVKFFPILIKRARLFSDCTSFCQCSSYIFKDVGSRLRMQKKEFSEVMSNEFKMTSKIFCWKSIPTKKNFLMYGYVQYRSNVWVKCIIMKHDQKERHN